MEKRHTLMYGEVCRGYGKKKGFSVSCEEMASTVCVLRRIVLFNLQRMSL